MVEYIGGWGNVWSGMMKIIGVVARIRSQVDSDRYSPYRINAYLLLVDFKNLPTATEGIRSPLVLPSL